MADSDVRAWAADRGMKVGARGVIPGEVREAYDAEMALSGSGPAGWPGAGDPPGGPAGPPPAAGGGDLWLDQLPDVPDLSDAGDDPPPLPDPGDMAEAVPGTPPRRAAGSPRRPRLGLPGRKAGKPKGRKPKRPRVPVDHLISDVWRGLAGFARPLPATSRILTIQAPLAGLMLEEAVKNTVMDAVLQPFARTGKNAELAWAMVGAPAITTMITLNPAQLPFLLPLLRSSLVAMIRIAGPRMAEALAEETEFEKVHGQTVDAMIVFLLQGVPVPDGQTEEQAEAETVRVLHEEMGAAAGAA